MKAPLSFGENAKIVYQHPYTHWNHVLKNLSFVTKKDGSIDGKLNISANIENNLPLYLYLSAYGIDVNGVRISDSRLSVEVDRDAEASFDGSTKTTPVNIIIRPKDNTIFKELDGMMLYITGSPTPTKGSDGNSVTGIQLNSNKHKVLIKNIAFKVIGQMAADLN